MLNLIDDCSGPFFSLFGLRCTHTPPLYIDNHQRTLKSGQRTPNCVLQLAVQRCAHTSSVRVQHCALALHRQLFCVTLSAYNDGPFSVHRLALGPVQPIYILLKMSKNCYRDKHNIHRGLKESILTYLSPKRGLGLMLVAQRRIYYLISQTHRE